MTKTVTYCSAIAALLMAASPLHAGSCAHSIARVQAQVDAVIENRASSDSPEPESLSALRGYQPTPYSLAETEGSYGRAYELALDSLGRARAADHVGDTASCLKELANARAALR